MRNREDIERFPSCEMDAAVAKTPPLCSFPDVEPKIAADPVETPSQTIRTTLTLLSFLAVPLILYISLPDPLQPLSMFVTAFAGHKILTQGAIEPVSVGVPAPEKKP